jgi:hypothetical protein
MLREDYENVVLARQRPGARNSTWHKAGCVKALA